MEDVNDIGNDFKMVGAINKSLEPGVALNATSHACLGLMARAQVDAPEVFDVMHFLNFTDADGQNHPFISARSLIVLRASNGELRKLRIGLEQEGLLTVNFTDTMTGQTFVEQLERTRLTPEGQLTYYGSKSTLDSLTRKLSLWR